MKEVLFLENSETEILQRYCRCILDDFYLMRKTAIFYSTYHQKAYFEDCPLRFVNNVKQLSNESCFYTKKALWKTYWKPEETIVDTMALSHYFDLSSRYLWSLYLCKVCIYVCIVIYMVYIYVCIVCIPVYGTLALCKLVSLLNSTSEHCLRAWSLRLGYFSHTTEL